MRSDAVVDSAEQSEFVRALDDRRSPVDAELVPDRRQVGLDRVLRDVQLGREVSSLQNGLSEYILELADIAWPCLTRKER